MKNKKSSIPHTKVNHHDSCVFFIAAAVCVCTHTHTSFNIFFQSSCLEMPLDVSFL